MGKQDDLQPFGVFSLNPKWVYYAGKPIENVVYCLNTIFLSSSKGFLKKICFFFSYSDQGLFSLLIHHVNLDRE